MKRKTLLIILTIVFAICSIIGLTACGSDDNEGGEPPSHTHEYTTLKFDSENHWYECYCGDKSGTENHSGGTATCTDKAICSICNQEYGKALGHLYGEKVTDGKGNHVQTCLNDSKHVIIEACSGGTATCTDKAICSVCGGAYGTTHNHNLDSSNFCKDCKKHISDKSASFVELGIPTLSSYKEKDTSNCAWDTYYYNGKIYRSCGDYSDDYKAVNIWAYDVSKGAWQSEYVTSDTAIQRFVEVDGKLMVPGTDPTGSWSYGNCYVLDENGWSTNSSVPNGVHMFDVIEHDGKIFYGLGVNYKQTPLVYTENGTDYTKVYFYNNNVKLDLSESAQGLSPIRVYELFTYKGDLYAFAIYQGVYGVYKFDGTKMVCVNEEAYYGQFQNNYNVWVSEFERDGIFYMVSGAIYAISDFSDAFAFTRYTPHKQVDVCDAVYRDGKYYLLCYVKTAVDGKYKTIIYESETMQKDSFSEVASFDYEIPPLSFDKVGKDFYVSMGGKNSIMSTKNGMFLKVTAN